MLALLKTAASFLFGGESKAESTVNFVQDSVRGVGNFIDEQNLTEEEAQQFALEKGRMILKAIEATRDENSTRSVTRRVLAWAIVGEFLGLLNVAIISRPFSIDFSDFLLDIMKDYWVGELTLGVAGFYFLTNIVRAGKK